MVEAPSLRLALVGLLCSLLGVGFAEFLAFAWVGLWGCEEVLTIDLVSSPSTPQHSPHRLLVISDVHILGEKRRTSIDRWWTDRQIGKSFASAKFWVNPHNIAVLGDHLDEGYVHTTQQLWNKYVARFRGALPADNLLMGIMGNHDAHSANLITPPMLSRFEKSFGSTNEVQIAGPLELVTLNGIGLEACYNLQRKHKVICEKLEATLNSLRFKEQQSPPYDLLARILLLHVPLYRENDADCGPTRVRESAHVTYVGPFDNLEAGKDVLSKSTTEYLLSTVKPLLVLSGHTHAQCARRVDKETFEVTLPTFSWRMRPDPGFAIIVVEDEKLKVSICKIPHEYRTITGYILAGLLSPAFLYLARKPRQGAGDNIITSQKIE